MKKKNYFQSFYLKLTVSQLRCKGKFFIDTYKKKAYFPFLL